LKTWKSLPDDNEVSKDLTNSVIHSIDATVEHLAASNVFFVAKRRNENKEVLYLSTKIPRGIPFLIELTGGLGVPGVKCATKTPNPEYAPLLFEAMETLLM
jgi:AP-1 complex subunit beta-1